MDTFTPSDYHPCWLPHILMLDIWPGRTGLAKNRSILTFPRVLLYLLVYMTQTEQVQLYSAFYKQYLL